MNKTLLDKLEASIVTGAPQKTPQYWLADKPSFPSATEARLIWIVVLERINGENNGKISFSVREAGAYAGCTPNTAGRMFNELITVGLLECTMKTSFTNGKKLASTWALTHLPIGGKLATNQWKSFETEPSNTSNTS